MYYIEIVLGVGSEMPGIINLLVAFIFIIGSGISEINFSGTENLRVNKLFTILFCHGQLTCEAVGMTK